MKSIGNEGFHFQAKRFRPKYLKVWCWDVDVRPKGKEDSGRSETLGLSGLGSFQITLRASVLVKDLMGFSLKNFLLGK